MIHFSKPSAAAVRVFLDGEAGRDFTYAAVGATAISPPTGYVVDRTRGKLGHGEHTFRAAAAALERWRHFELGWVEAVPREDGIRPGVDVAVLVRTFGVWWLNSCRIVYVVSEDAGPVLRSGFAYGTLPGHAESGEERFVVEWNRDDDSVWYDILAFSRPRHLLARVGRPIVRRFQKRFGRDSVRAMLNAVVGSSAAGAPTGDLV